MRAIVFITLCSLVVSCKRTGFDAEDEVSFARACRVRGGRLVSITHFRTGKNVDKPLACVQDIPVRP